MLPRKFLINRAVDFFYQLHLCCNIFMLFSLLSMLKYDLVVTFAGIDDLIIESSPVSFKQNFYKAFAYVVLKFLLVLSLIHI